MPKRSPNNNVAKPSYVPQHHHAKGDPLSPVTKGQWIWCPVKSDWRIIKPEEMVRQEYILLLHHRYGYAIEQMDQERRTKHGRKSPKADIVVWETVEARRIHRAPLIVVECKSDNVTIDPGDYEQGDSYARAIGGPCEFLVSHNKKETRFFRIIRGLPGKREDIENIPSLDDIQDTKKMRAIRRATKAFSREEFRRLLYECHCILRDNHKMEPGKAFDEISKVLFLKMYIERTGNYEKFTTAYLDEYARIRRRKLDDVMHDLFDDTKKHYKADDLFGKDDRLAISFATFLRIVGLLERFNLGSTSDDIKGIAFERFLGQTFRGELGQFFTPRPIVDFMVEVLNPTEGAVMCDPASGSGGFLIKFFEHVRANIEHEIHEKKRRIRAAIKRKKLDEDSEAEQINTAFAKLNEELDVSSNGSRLWSIAQNCIFGIDAEPRAARTSKMNMIMHGDGHGGIHHHDGLIDINGIFPNRFDIVLTNPPFGSKVEDDQIVGATTETRVESTDEQQKRYEQLFGEQYLHSYARMLKAEQNKDTILSLYDVPKSTKSEKTEVLFLERCINLVKPGGRIGIIVPDGILNNPSQIHVREFIEDRARIIAVVSIPDKTFRSSKTNVTASLLFLQKFSHEESRKIAEARMVLEKQALERVQSVRETLSTVSKVTWRQYENKRDKPIDEIRSVGIWAAVEHYGSGLSQESFEIARKAVRLELKKLNIDAIQSPRKDIRNQFDYDVFMAIADHVGIRASGKEDPLNELSELVDIFRHYQASPNSVERDVRKPTFRIKWSEMDRWDPSSFRPIEWKCDPDILKPLGSELAQRRDLVDRDIYDFSELTPITIHFDGSIDVRDVSDTDDYTMDLYFARPGDIVVSKIDLKNGAVGIIPHDLENVVVTNHFVIYQPNLEKLYPSYLTRLIQTSFFKNYLWRKKVGSEGRKEVKIDLFEKTVIPLPSPAVQKRMVEKWCALAEKRQQIEDEMKAEAAVFERYSISGGPSEG